MIKIHGMKLITLKLKNRNQKRRKSNRGRHPLRLLAFTSTGMSEYNCRHVFACMHSHTDTQAHTHNK